MASQIDVDVAVTNEDYGKSFFKILFWSFSESGYVGFLMLYVYSTYTIHVETYLLETFLKNLHFQIGTYKFMRISFLTLVWPLIYLHR
jgi:hypothetical protein